MKNQWIAFLLVIIVVFSCNKNEELPVYGHVTFDSIFTNQNGEHFSQEDVDGKIYISDFFFTHCPAICPKMTAQLLRVQDAFKPDDILITSFSVDVERDTPERLKWYQDKNGISAQNWQLLTGNQVDVDSLSARMMIFQEADSTAPGGFNHMGKFLLIDKKGQIRGAYNGVDPEEVDELMEDLKQLIK